MGGEGSGVIKCGEGSGVIMGGEESVVVKGGERSSVVQGDNGSDLTRFNKIAIPNYKFQMASGQGSHWLIESPTIFSSMCSPPLSNICHFYF